MRKGRLSGALLLATAGAASSRSSTGLVETQPAPFASNSATVGAALSSSAAEKTYPDQVRELPGRHFWPIQSVASGLGVAKNAALYSAFRKELGSEWEDSAELGALDLNYRRQLSSLVIIGL